MLASRYSVSKGIDQVYSRRINGMPRRLEIEIENCTLHD